MSPETGDMERYWHVRLSHWPGRRSVSTAPGPFLRADREKPLSNELVIGQWGSCPVDSAKTAKLTYSDQPTPASEEITSRRPSGVHWSYGWRCIIPPGCRSTRPDTGSRCKNVWWRFRRADGHPGVLLRSGASTWTVRIR